MIPFMVARLACLSIPADPGRFRQRLPIASRHVQSEARTQPVSRWLVVGCDGMLGQDLVAALRQSPGGSPGEAPDVSLSASMSESPGASLSESLSESPGASLSELRGAHEVTAVDRDVLDIIDPDACLEAVAGHDFVVNVAAVSYTHLR